MKPVLNVIACPPADMDARQMLGIADIEPWPGTVETCCDRCFKRVLLAPSQQLEKKDKPNSEVWCFPCVIHHCGPELATKVFQLAKVGMPIVNTAELRNPERN